MYSQDNFENLLSIFTVGVRRPIKSQKTSPGLEKFGPDPGPLGLKEDRHQKYVNKKKRAWKIIWNIHSMIF